MSFSDYLENAALNYIFREGAAIASTDVHISLHDTAAVSDVKATMEASEVTGGSYARQTVLSGGWNAAASGLIDNVSAIDFAGMPAVTVGGVGVWDKADSTGNLLAAGALSAEKTTNSSDTFRFAAGDLDITLA